MKKMIYRMSIVLALSVPGMIQASLTTIAVSQQEASLKLKRFCDESVKAYSASMEHGIRGELAKWQTYPLQNQKIAYNYLGKAFYAGLHPMIDQDVKEVVKEEAAKAELHNRIKKAYEDIYNRIGYEHGLLENSGHEESEKDVAKKSPPKMEEQRRAKFMQNLQARDKQDLAAKKDYKEDAQAQITAAVEKPMEGPEILPVAQQCNESMLSLKDAMKSDAQAKAMADFHSEHWRALAGDPHNPKAHVHKDIIEYTGLAYKNDYVLWWKDHQPYVDRCGICKNASKQATVTK